MFIINLNIFSILFNDKNLLKNHLTKTSLFVSKIKLKSKKSRLFFWFSSMTYCVRMGICMKYPEDGVTKGAKLIKEHTIRIMTRITKKNLTIFLVGDPDTETILKILGLNS